MVCCIECFECFPFLALTNSLWINPINSSVPCSCTHQHIYFRDTCHNIPVYFKKKCVCSFVNSPYLIFVSMIHVSAMQFSTFPLCIGTFQEPKFQLNFITQFMFVLVFRFLRNEWGEKREEALISENASLTRFSSIHFASISRFTATAVRFIFGVWICSFSMCFFLLFIYLLRFGGRSFSIYALLRNLCSQSSVACYAIIFGYL